MRRGVHLCTMPRSVCYDLVSVSEPHSTVELLVTHNVGRYLLVMQ